MDDFGPQIAPAVVAACQAAAAKAGQAFSQAFDATFELSVGEPAVFSAAAPPDDFKGPGFVVQFSLGEQAILLLLPESAGLLPSWYNQPTPTHSAKLATLTQELGVLLPESLTVKEATGAAVADLPAVLLRCECAEGAAIVWLNLGAAGGQPGKLAFVWPIGKPAAVFDPQPATSESPSAPVEQPAEKVANPPEQSAATPEQSAIAPEPVGSTPLQSVSPPEPVSTIAGRESSDQSKLDALPRYSRSLLKIKVPVMVTLAIKKQAVSKIIEIVPGTILQFEKSCEETLELEVATHRVAQGECVKVGEKFGLRITSLILPAERFRSVAATAG
jgi:flagellar motor switch protein FliN/FliY